MFGLSPFKELKKELHMLYEKQYELQDKEDNNEPIGNSLDKVLEEIDKLIEGRYSQKVFEYYSKKSPDLIRIRTGEVVSWKDAFGNDFEQTTKSQRHSLVGLVEGGTRYKLR